MIRKSRGKKNKRDGFSPICFARYYRRDAGSLPELRLLPGAYYIFNASDRQYFCRAFKKGYITAMEVLHDVSDFIYSGGFRLRLHKKYTFMRECDFINLGDIESKNYNMYCRKVQAISNTEDQLIAFKLML